MKSDEGAAITLSKLKSNRHIRYLVIALCVSFSNTAMGEIAQTTVPNQIVAPPNCVNNKGEIVSFIDRKGREGGLAGGMAIRDSSGQPIVYRSNYAATSPEFQSFIDRHECAHHQLGDVDRPHPARNSPEHLMNESISDCVAILRLRDESGYDQTAYDVVVASMRNDMAKIGFPEISISSRIKNIQNCYSKFGSAQDFINGVMKERG